MSLNYAPQTLTAEDYERAFGHERRQEYPVIDAFEQRMGFAIDRERLEAAARVLSCPIKAAAPNWQHGRVLYAVTRRYLADRPTLLVARTLDIGSAKGFSALCVRWAIEDEDEDMKAESVSVDVMPPDARVRRNTVAEVDGLKTLHEILAPFPAAQRITFLESTGIYWLNSGHQRIHIAFVDGKHTGAVVKVEGQLLAARQEAGDVVVFDDVHIPDVGAAVDSLSKLYDLERIQVLPKRAYAIARRK